MKNETMQGSLGEAESRLCHRVGMFTAPVCHTQAALPLPTGPAGQGHLPPPPSYPYLCLCPELFLVRIPPLILVSFWTCCNKVTAYIKLCISKQLLLPISLQRQRLGSEQLIQRMFISQTEDSRKKIAAMFVFSDLIRHLATTACVLSKRATTRVKVQANLRSPTTISSSLRMVSSMQNLVFCGLI